MKPSALVLACALAVASAPLLAAPQASTAASAAAPDSQQELNPQGLHIALSSLLLAATKMAVEDVILKTGKAPATNAAAHVGEPDYLTTNEISSITVHKGGVLEVHFTSAVSPFVAGVWLTPMREGNQVKWSCVSHDIVRIHDIESYCTYQPKH